MLSKHSNPNLNILWNILLLLLACEILVFLLFVSQTNLMMLSAFKSKIGFKAKVIRADEVIGSMG